ncbi:HDOD domain-containing protein [Ectothiorhodospira lacustris]|uniref:HDOD domain-containing protein n=1 Tax=Ectothiorhodospira lacustris TaxID=2899127 RepID=UPI001EE7D181|nr:HDOD domain-containing protein [Ectothiorhodospira lacustris]MCG5501695.1 HDOD domain-containing protein [Ectothiorhodospira lacustris]
MGKHVPGQWVGVFGERGLPLLPGTRGLLADLDSDQISSMRLVARLIQRDPGLALSVVRTANAVPHRHFHSEVVSLDEAAMMIGIQGILRCMENVMPLERLLDPAAQARYLQVAARSAYTALLAEVWGDIRHDMIPAEVSLAGLFYNLGELVLAAHEERRIQRYLSLMADSSVLPHEAEYVALDLSLRAVGHQLAESWQLPEMVRHCMRPANARHLRTLGVMLAAKLAREAMRGWCSPGLVGDLRLAAEYLDVDAETVVTQINRVSGEFNLYGDLYGIMAPIPELQIEDIAGQLPQGPTSPAPAFCLAPRSDRFAQAEARLQAAASADEDEVVEVLLAGLHHGLGLNRVVFARLEDGGERLVPASMEGTDYEPDFNRATIDLNGRHLLTVLMRRPASFWLNPGNVAEMWPQVPESLRAAIGVQEFFAHSLFAGEHPVGMVYADRRSRACALDKRALAGFNRLTTLAQAELLRLQQAAGARPRPRAEPIRTLR